MKGIVESFSFEKEEMTFIKQGVKKRDQLKYARYPGGNGTYVTGGSYDSYIIIKIFVDELQRYVSFDIKEEVLAISNRSRVSAKLVSDLNEKNVGKEVEIEINGSNYNFDVSQLDI